VSGTLTLAGLTMRHGDTSGNAPLQRPDHGRSDGHRRQCAERLHGLPGCPAGGGSTIEPHGASGNESVGLFLEVVQGGVLPTPSSVRTLAYGVGSAPVSVWSRPSRRFPAPPHSYWYLPKLLHHPCHQGIQILPRSREAPHLRIELARRRQQPGPHLAHGQRMPCMTDVAAHQCSRSLHRGIAYPLPGSRLGSSEGLEFLRFSMAKGILQMSMTREGSAGKRTLRAGKQRGMPTATPRVFSPKGVHASGQYSLREPA
jgi:hypothetical protein